VARAKSFSADPFFARPLISARPERMILLDFARFRRRSMSPSLSIVHHFASLTDPRVRRRRRHQLNDIISIAICGVICGCKSWGEIALYGHKKADWLHTFLELPNGIPSKDTFRRLFARIQPTAFQSCFRSWTEALTTTLGVKQIAIDGKTVRRSHDRGAGKTALHLVSAWATANRLTLGQVAVSEKSNEITAIPQLLELLDLSGAIVTIDAMGCQKEIARQIRDGDGHYVLAVKNNQERLFDDVEASFATELERAEKEGRSSYHRTVEQKHGRIESRQYFTIDQPRGIRDEALWKDLRTICMVVSERQVVGEVATSEIRYYIGSKKAKAKEYARYVRGHWGIENSLHWVLDMVFDEDRNRTRKDHGPENLAWMRRLAIAVLSNTKSCSGSIRTKQLHAILDDQVLEGMLSTFSTK
jgi:predicted transposase YbfD/YdcC